jgi:hypothetical protein
MYNYCMKILDKEVIICRRANLFEWDLLLRKHTYIEKI